MKHIIVGIVLTTALCLGAFGVSAQTADSGALTGNVTDATGAVIPNVTVTATSVDTGQARTSVTSSDGTYKFNLLPPGNYRVRFEATGFRSVEVPSAAVTVTETAVLDRTLQVGSQTQEVTVEANVENVQTATSALGTVVGTQTVVDLPLSTRNYTNLLAMSTGAQASVNNASGVGKGSTTIAVNGSSTYASTYLQDGVAINNWFSFNQTTEATSYGAFPIANPDAIEEFKIQTSTYDAGYGRNPGANVNVVTKSGTNDFHGTAFEFLRNTIFNANDWFRNYTGGSRLVLNQNQLGGSVGGPVKNNKLFFFANYQETQQKNGVAPNFGYTVATLPPIPNGNRGTCPVLFTSVSQCDAAGQAFIANLGAQVCPSTHPGNKSDNTSIGGLQVACNGSNINPVAISLLQLKLANGNYGIPGSGSTAGAYLPATFTGPALYYDHQGIGNFDYVINAKHTLSGRYLYETDPITAQFPNVASTLPGNPVYEEKTNHVALLKLTSILSNNFVNEARVSYQRNVSRDHELGKFTNSQVGIVDETPGIDLLTFTTVTGFFSFGEHFYFQTYIPEDQFEWADQISWTRGGHAIRAGFEVQRVEADQTYPSLGIGNPTFASFPDFLLGRAACPAGSFGAGAGQCNASNPGTSNGTASTSNVQSPGSNSTPNGRFNYEFREINLNGFVQDDFKVNSRLTLNAGVRWEYDGYPSEKFGNFSDIWLSVVKTDPIPGPSAAAGSLVGFVVPSNYRGPMPAGILQSNRKVPTQSGPPLDDFAPRLGFAWQPTGASKWVVRGGGGYFYDLVGGNLAQSLYDSTPGVGFPVPSPLATFQDPWATPATVPGPAGSFGFTPRWVSPTGAGSNLGQPVFQQNMVVPTTYEWNLDTQYEFAPNWVLEFDYVGSHGVHQSTAGGVTTVPYNWALLASPGSPLSCGYDGVATDCITTNTAQNAPLRAQYLGFSTAGTEYVSTESYKYNSLQITVRKQLSRGLQMQAAYTWSRGFATYPYGINSYPYVILQYGLNTQYHPQRLVVNYTYTLPLGHPAGLKGKLVEGWTFSGVTTIQDGTPLNLTDSQGGTVFGAAPTVSTPTFAPGMGVQNLTTTGSLDQRVISGLTGGAGYLNGRPSGVLQKPLILGSDGAATGFGNVGLGPVLSPGQNDWDMALAKVTRVGGLREDATLLFRAEFFNTFNHPQFSSPTVNAASALYGQIASTSVNPRLIQFALKYSF